jgi:perosamine synthetase
VSLLTYHLPTYSPLSLRSLWEAARGGIAEGTDAANTLRGILCAEYGAERQVLCGSGAQALQLAIETAVATAPVGPRGRKVVALPAFTCYEVASAAIGAGVDVALYDLTPDHLAPDPDSFGRVLERGVAAVVVSPLFGVPVQWEPLEEIATAHGAVLIEDAAQGNGGSWRGRRLGSKGALSVLSFGRGKGWSGIRGGALLLRGRLAEAKLSPEEGLPSDEFCLAVAGVAQWALGRPSVYRLPRSIPWLGLGQTRYHDPAPPRAMTRLGAALALRSRMAAADEAAARRRNARFYLENLPREAFIDPIRVPVGGTAGYLRLPIRLRHGIRGFARRPTHLGIEAAYPLPISELPQLRPHVLNTSDSCPGAVELSRRLVTLPTHSRLGDEDRRRVVELVAGYGAG